MNFFRKKTLLKEVNVLFVCMGNICRSPSAQGVLENLIKDEFLEDKVGVDSAGTYAYHHGERPDPRARAAATKRGYDISKQKARKVISTDFEIFDYVLAMDSENLQDLLEICEDKDKEKVQLFLNYSTKKNKHKDMPDPYYGGLAGFETVLDLAEDAAKGLLKHIKAKHQF